jgi:5-methylcytosine-specific restriction endonuclease McrA
MKTYNCIQCEKKCSFSHQKRNKFCSNDCQHQHRRAQTFSRLLEGEITGRDTIRSTLIYQFGHKCMSCELTEWLGQPIPLEVDHTDGNAGNNAYENLKLLCANCHGITPTWKGKNRGNGRAARGLKLS